MKGVVFTECHETVEQHFSTDMVDDVIVGARLPFGGVYTAVGTYAHGEMVARVNALSQRFGLAVQWLIHAAVHQLHPSADRLVLLFQSPRHFVGLAESLMHGCVAPFQEPIRITRDFTKVAQDAQRFVLTRHA